ncbi:alanine--tRNA ligase [Dokdonella soli]|uniref:Alanine--tRNA ligase n=1 Tax=Dokdonella soli TaxID=529810 RepID=A0ABN1IRY3_9GAMM
MKTSEIRSAFLEFFRSKGHTIVPSSSLVPSNDPTLLFTNSGMVQFKNVFLGSEKLGYVRAADVQRCLRAGGKHNDLDSVGYTARHHTFFEMLGNWSFGDYFKREAIAWAWEFLTGTLKLHKDRLWVTVYHTDDEAFDIWNKDIGVPAARIVRIGDNKGAPYASDNFWQMADTGPCGPCTEIFYDHGPGIPGGPPGSPDEDGDRYIEIWNLVFMQFDRAADGTLSKLPAPCVDTGMGLERLAAVLQHVHSNYEIDLFQHLIKVAAKLTNTADLENKSLRVIADHIRACSFLIVDGVLPSNEGRGYVLRRIIRRALRHGYMLQQGGLGQKQPFFHAMVGALVEVMGDAYPELLAKREFVERALKAEEERFGETLEQGMKVFEDVAKKSGNAIPGDAAFRLYDTYGFPVDLTADIARERGLTVDMAGFELAMEQQRERARSASQFEGRASLPAELASTLAPTKFLGYETLAADGCKVLALVRAGRAVDSLNDGEDAIVILDRTPFYAESGGQVGDSGVLTNADGRFEVGDTIKLGGVFHAHVGRWGGKVLKPGASITAQVDGARRQSTVLNHSATHLLHAALRKELGTHVQQKGSLVAPDRLRFDFSHFQPIGADELRRIEDLVNAEIRRNTQAEVREMAYQDALDFGALALFGEKYGDEVRVLRMGEFSTELCGGTHVGRTGDIGLFKIVGESGVAAGVRRIEAVTGAAAIAFVAEEEARLDEIGGLLSAHGGELVDKLRQLFDRQKKLERELESLKAKAASSATQDLAANARKVGDISIVAARVDGLDAKALREGVDTLKQKLIDCVVLLATGSDGKASLVGGVHGAALGKVKAGDVVAHVAALIGGKGGGRPDMAQGGGVDSPALDSALAALPEWIANRLA